jgi:hypothetical protein
MSDTLPASQVIVLEENTITLVEVGVQGPPGMSASEKQVLFDRLTRLELHGPILWGLWVDGAQWSDALNWLE